ncbi:hypothetical protein ABB37_06832 [Leptomonas pyrrhocoris]|uniref:Uncharacterized protein n=1 Tax=Leptomonas pyrrhocoris TaxID=157538 RepID=A0A0N0DTP9_LEPPY|nr:hypothetical protein ABB37_06832 [Leptomonas pyrrhocoris]KPA77431.1 hypothetical protein ABB37_06832 [Leptomonas pyrrhocoris]|eukprot:XP_015655870.1 hypothetical protein ABB37_06832 [Leptomonas pyrrhocoris]
MWSASTAPCFVRGHWYAFFFLLFSLSCTDVRLSVRLQRRTCRPPSDLARGMPPILSTTSADVDLYGAIERVRRAITPTHAHMHKCKGGKGKRLLGPETETCGPHSLFCCCLLMHFVTQCCGRLLWLTCTPTCCLTECTQRSARAVSKNEERWAMKTLLEASRRETRVALKSTFGKQAMVNNSFNNKTQQHSFFSFLSFHLASFIPLDADVFALFLSAV